MEKEDLKKILDYAMSVSFMISNIEDLIEDYKNSEELTEKQLCKIEKRIEIVKKFEKDIKELLGIKK